MIRPGEVYYADFGSAGIRPIIVVSRESLNRGNTVLAVICTTARLATRTNLRNCVPFAAGDFGLFHDCVAQCENLHTVDKQFIDLAAGPIGTLDDTALRDVIRAIGYVIESDCEPE